jgi:hypothetical protein
MARTRHRSTAVQSYKRSSDELLQKVTNVLYTLTNSLIASGEEVESNEVVAKKKCVNKEQMGILH